MLSDSVPSQRGGIDIREFLRILRRRLRIVVVTPLLLFAAAAVYVAMVQPLYTATSTILIDPRRAAIVDPVNRPAPSNANADDVTIESQVMLAQSVAVLQRVVEHMKLTDDPEFAPQPGMLASVRWLFSVSRPDSGMSDEAFAKVRTVEALQKRLKVARQHATFLVDINISARNPAKAAAVANAIADAYFIEQVRSKYDAIKIATDWLTRQIDGLRTHVFVSEKAVADFRTANNLIVAQGVTVNDQQISDVNNQLIEARAKAAEARAKYDQAQEITQRGADAGSVAEALSSDIIARLRAQYGESSKNAADLSTRYGPRHPLVAAAQAQVRDTQRRIDEEIERILQSRRHEFEVAAARERSLQKSLEDLQAVSSESSQAQVRLRELQREAESSRTLYESFLARQKETSAQESLELPEARVVARAETPIHPSFPRSLLILAFSIVAGFGLGSMLALLDDYFDPRLKTMRQAEEATGVRAIAAVPLVDPRELARLAKRGRRELQRYDPATARLLPPGLQPPLMRYAIEQPTSVFAEAVRAVRLAVQHAARGKGGRIAMVTSAVDGEGKTTLAANLAFSFATIGVRTILVEGDLRHPELTRSLCPRAPDGLVEVAAEHKPLHQSILVDQSTGLSILPAPAPDDPTLLAEFVFFDSMNVILNELRQHYDLVIVDAPPLIPLVDGRMLAEYADDIILAAGWDRTPRDLLTHALEHLDYVRERVIGVVLSQVDLKRAGLYDRYYSSTYYRPYDFTIETSPEPAA